MATDSISSIPLEHLSTTQPVSELAENKFTFLDETEVSLDQLHQHMCQTFTSVPSPAPSLPDQADEETLQTSNILFILAFLATVAGSLLMVFTGF